MQKNWSKQTKGATQERETNNLTQVGLEFLQKNWEMR
jgi:hypothetical protein